MMAVRYHNELFDSDSVYTQFLFCALMQGLQEVQVVAHVAESVAATCPD